ncbi:MAG: hypothetical protein M1816_004317 [Peltula sp. TS41687]|nr:MAG: hypothetical protein M1816_004317 [Peltula sp. TS41687]
MTRAESFVALKVLTADCYGGDRDEIGPELFERDVLQLFARTSLSHPGHDYVPHLLDTFSVRLASAEHMCFVYLPMAEGLDIYQKRFPKWRVPQPVMKRIARQVLLALDYAHSCDVIHCDVGEKNILLDVDDEATFAQYMADVPKAIEEARREPNRPVPSTDLRVPRLPLRVKARLMDWGAASFGSKHLVEQIYPGMLRPPEVILDAGWNSKVDIWALGLLIWRLFETMLLFDGLRDVSKPYDMREHVRQMVHFLGPPPKSLLARGTQSKVQVVISNPSAVALLAYERATGHLRDEPLTLPLTLDNAEVNLDGDNKQAFLAFIRGMLCWDPEERRTANELLGDQWLNMPDTIEEIELLSPQKTAAR